MNPSSCPPDICVVLDANVLITLLNINRIDILSGLKGYEFYAPNHVVKEVHRKAQRARLRKALSSGGLKELRVIDIVEIELYAKYRQRFGDGESACLAVGRNRGWRVASDEKAVKKEVTAVMGIVNLMDTNAILEAAVKQEILTRSEFDGVRKNFNF